MSSPLNIISRSDWGAEPPKEGGPAILLKGKCARVFMTYADSPICEEEAECKAAVWRIQTVDMQVQGLRDIRFNFLVGKDGNVYEGRGWHTAPILPTKYAKYDNCSLFISFIGDFTVESLPKAMDDLACDLIRFGIKNNYIRNDFQYFDVVNVTE